MEKVGYSRDGRQSPYKQAHPQAQPENPAYLTMTDDFRENCLSFDDLTHILGAHKRCRIDEVLQRRTRHVTVVLEDVFLSHNASACLRSCEAFGIQDVHLIENEYAYRLSADVAVGSAQWLTLVRHHRQEQNTRTCIEQLKEQGYRVLATTPHETGCTLREYDVRQKTALLFGREKEGLSPTAMEHADDLLTIPTPGFTGSLNISVAVSVCLFHFTEKLRDSDIDWQLSDAEQETLRAQWIRRSVMKKIGRQRQKFWNQLASRGEISLDELEQI